MVPAVLLLSLLILGRCACCPIGEQAAEVRLTVSGADAIPWTRELQATMVALLSSLTGLDTRQITVINAELQSSACSRRLLAAAPSGMRLTVDICTPAAALSATFGTLERLYTDQGSIQDSFVQSWLQQAGYSAIAVQPASISLAAAVQLAHSRQYWITCFIAVTCALGSMVLALSAMAIYLAFSQPGMLPHAWHDKHAEKAGQPDLQDMLPECYPPDAAPHKGEDFPGLAVPVTAGKQVEAAPNQPAGQLAQPSPSAESMHAELDVAGAMGTASAPAAMCLAPLIHSIPAGLPEEVQRCYADFLNIWSSTEPGDTVWRHPTSSSFDVTNTAPMEVQASATASVPLSMAQTSSESEQTLMTSIMPLSALLARYPNWEISVRDLAFSFMPDGHPLILRKSAHSTCYMGALRETVQVAVQVLEYSSDSFHKDTIAEVSAQLLELNSCPYLPHFYGTIIADKPMLVFEFISDNLRTLLTDEAEDPFWYGRGKQLALDIARGLSFMHSRDLMLGNLMSSNIMLDGSGIPKFNAVGVNALLVRARKCRRRDLYPLDWAPPEVLLGQKCGPAADIFQFAILLWELITKDIPIRGALRAVSAVEECPAAIASLIASCMDRNSASRPSCAQIAVTILETWDCRPPVQATGTASTPSPCQTASPTLATQGSPGSAADAQRHQPSLIARSAPGSPYLLDTGLSIAESTPAVQQLETPVSPYVRRRAISPMRVTPQLVLHPSMERAAPISASGSAPLTPTTPISRTRRARNPRPYLLQQSVDAPQGMAASSGMAGSVRRSSKDRQQADGVIENRPAGLDSAYQPEQGKAAAGNSEAVDDAQIKGRLRHASSRAARKQRVLDSAHSVASSSNSHLPESYPPRQAWAGR